MTGTVSRIIDSLHFMFYRIVYSLEAITDNIVLSPGPSSNFSSTRPNIAVTVFDLSPDDDNGWIHGVGVDRFADGLKPFLSATSPSDVAGQFDGAILMSRDVLDNGRAANGKTCNFKRRLTSNTMHMKLFVADSLQIIAAETVNLLSEHLHRSIFTLCGGEGQSEGS